MQLREKSKPDAEPVHMDWDQAQAALRTGKYEIASEGPESEGDRGEQLVADISAATPTAKDTKDAKAS